MVESECQEVLEKFEFFPLKCRVQRALEIYEISQRQKEESTELEYVFKTKVPCCSFTHASFNIQRHFHGQIIYAVLQCQCKFPASVCTSINHPTEMRQLLRCHSMASHLNVFNVRPHLWHRTLNHGVINVCVHLTALTVSPHFKFARSNLAFSAPRAPHRAPRKGSETPAGR